MKLLFWRKRKIGSPLCRLFGHDWARDDYVGSGFTYDPNWKGGEGPPPIISSWMGYSCRRPLCSATEKRERIYDAPTSAESFVKGEMLW